MNNETLDKIKSWCSKNVTGSYVIFEYGTVILTNDNPRIFEIHEKYKKSDKPDYAFLIPETPKHRYIGEKSPISIDNMNEIIYKMNKPDKYIYLNSLGIMKIYYYPMPGLDLSDRFVQYLEKDDMWITYWKYYIGIFSLLPGTKEIKTDTVPISTLSFFGYREDYINLKPYHIHYESCVHKIFGKDIIKNHPDISIWDNETDEHANSDPKKGVRVFSAKT